jgi:dTDP-glucose 4,6-dehydratase
VKKYLVTGGLGFIGSNFINSLYKVLIRRGEEFEIHCVDKETYAASSNNLESEILNSIHFVLHKIDICGPEVINLMRNNNFVFCAHFAAESHVDRSIEEPSIFLQTNVIGTTNLLNGWRNYQTTKFLHVSTDEVYGSLESGEASEEHILDPSSPYSASKAASDLLVLSYIRTFQIDAIVTRCTNNFGLNQNREKLIPKLIFNIMNGSKLGIYSDGLNVREWIHVDDHVSALLALLGANKLKNKVYNIGSGIRKSNLEIVDLIKRISGIEDAVVEHTKDRPGHDFRYAVNSNLLCNELNWTPENNLEVGIEQLISHFRLTGTFETSH